MSKKVDKGFEPIYWNLSYRRKFIRTLWLLQFGIILAIYLLISHSNKFVGFLIIFFVTWVIQLIYTYYKWKSSDKLGETQQK